MTNEDQVFLDLLVNAPKYLVDGIVLVNGADLFGGEAPGYIPVEELTGEIKDRRWGGGQRTEDSRF